MEVLKAEFVRGFIRMASDSWDQGWHERNGGNLSYRIKPEEVEPLFDKFCFGEWQPIGVSVPGIAEEYFLITAAGSFFRNISLYPEECFGIIQVDREGSSYRVCWGFANGGCPTSELPMHLMSHEVKKASTGGKNRVIHHAHPANIIALTFLLPLDSETFTRELWQMISECAMVFPEGVGVLPWMVPGSLEIAVASAELMKRKDAVIWAHHGIFCSGETFDLAFGLMHTIEKAAEILIKVLSVSPQKLNTITDENLKSLASAYGLELIEA